MFQSPKTASIKCHFKNGCELTFNSQELLERHMKYCHEYNYENLKSMDNNIVNNDYVNKQKKFSDDAITNVTSILQCRFCDGLYSKENNLRNHVLGKHFKEKLLPFIPNVKPFQCPD